jgi:DivIVA domain-containing protein
MPSSLPTFPLTFRGYDRDEVDALLTQIVSALDSRDPGHRSQALSALHRVAIPLQFRGYDRGRVDAYINEARASLAN